MTGRRGVPPSFDPCNTPFTPVALPPGMTEAAFTDAMRSATGVKIINSGLYVPFVNDCHTGLARAFKKFGVKYPGSPEGRIGTPRTCKKGDNTNEGDEGAQCSTCDSPDQIGSPQSPECE